MELSPCPSPWVSPGPQRKLCPGVSRDPSPGAGASGGEEELVEVSPGGAVLSRRGHPLLLRLQVQGIWGARGPCTPCSLVLRPDGQRGPAPDPVSL